MDGKLTVTGYSHGQSGDGGSCHSISMVKFRPAPPPPPPSELAVEFFFGTELPHLPPTFWDIPITLVDHMNLDFTWISLALLGRRRLRLRRTRRTLRRCTTRRSGLHLRRHQVRA